MEGDISVARIANAICQDTTFCGVYLLVEGKQDHKLYGKFVDTENVRIKVAAGKYRLREIYALLMQRGYTRALGIRDADFLRIKGNPKYSSDFSDRIYVTDCHDAEIMILRCGVIVDFLRLISDEEHISAFESKFGPVSEVVVNAVYPLGCLRLANRRFHLGLSFGPERPEGNQMKIKKFISDHDWRADLTALVNTAWEYSQNRKQPVAPRERILEALNEIILENHPAYEVINGHDFAAAMHLLSIRGLKSTSRLLQDPSCVQDLFVALFDLSRFSSTNLYRMVQQWGEETRTPSVFASLK